MEPALIDRLRSARLAMGGLDANGRRVHPSMFDRDVISLAHGDGVRRPHAATIAGGVAALLETETASLDDYLFLQRHEEFDAAITDDFITHGVPPEIAANVCVDSGTTRLFAGFLHTVSQPGDIIGVPRSYYHPVPSWCDLARVNLKLIRTGPQSDYKLTAQTLSDWYGQHRDRRPRAVMLFNPTQTGALYTPEEMAAIAAVIKPTGMTVLEDCVFAGTEFPGQRPVCHLVAVAPELADQVVTLKGGSKAYNLANIRIGWGCGPARLIRAMNDYMVVTTVTVPFLAKAMALAALRAPAKYLADNARECSERAALVTALVHECNEAVGHSGERPMLAVSHQPQAGHGILVAAPGLAGRRLPDGSAVRHSIDLTRFLLSAANVAVSPGYSLGFDGTEMRLVFGSVGLKSTYPPTMASEIGFVLHKLAAICGRSRPAAARSLHEAAEIVYGTGIEPGPELFQPGRNLIVAAFRERITVAIRSLLENRTDHELAPLR